MRQDGGVPPMQVLAERTDRFNAPVSVVSRALTKHRERWIRLEAGEQLPEVLASEGGRVTWSSFWPISPNDTVEFDLARRGAGCEMRFRWRTDSPPDARGVGITRQRLNRKLASDLRGWLVTDEAWRDTAL